MDGEAIKYFLRNSPWAKQLPSYQTQLNPGEEQQFNEWASKNANRIGPASIINNPYSDYDYRGWWRENQGVDAPDGHFIDKFKTPYHETFSNESQYSTPDAPHWEQQGKSWRLISKDGKVLKEE